MKTRKILLKHLPSLKASAVLYFTYSLSIYHGIVYCLFLDEVRICLIFIAFLYNWFLCLLLKEKKGHIYKFRKWNTRIINIFFFLISNMANGGIFNGLIFDILHRFLPNNDKDQMSNETREIKFFFLLNAISKGDVKCECNNSTENKRHDHLSISKTQTHRIMSSRPSKKYYHKNAI